MSLWIGAMMYASYIFWRLYGSHMDLNFFTPSHVHSLWKTSKTTFWNLLYPTKIDLRYMIVLDEESTHSTDVLAS